MLLLLFFTTSPGYAGNPFTSAPGEKPKAPAMTEAPVKNKFFIHIVSWQHQLREKMSGLIHEAKTGEKVTPVFYLAMFSFLYGMLHSTGPGHGKAVALSYIFTCRPSLSQGLLFGNLAALTHGFSGIFLVLLVKFILHAGINQSLEATTYFTRLISFSLISIMGIFLLYQSLRTRFRKAAQTGRTKKLLFTNPPATAVAVGMVPCPGVVMVMLFAVSLNLTILGIFLGSCIALGMAVTITLTVLAGMSGKAVILNASGRRKS